MPQSVLTEVFPDAIKLPIAVGYHSPLLESELGFTLSPLLISVGAGRTSEASAYEYPCKRQSTLLSSLISGAPHSHCTEELTLPCYSCALQVGTTNTSSHSCKRNLGWTNPDVLRAAGSHLCLRKFSERREKCLTSRFQRSPRPSCTVRRC